MNSARYTQIEDLFHAALGQAAPERRAFVEEECGKDAALMAEVLAMLEADSRPAALLDRGLPDVAFQMIGAPLDLDGSREIGPYQLKRLLGEGGMGVVWLAERKDAGNQVAIKFLPHAGLSPARRERFVHEIRTLAKLKHPYIARLYDAGNLPDGTPWFVMEHVDGARFTEYCRSGQRTIDEDLRLFRKVCEAVQYAHGQEIIHRDLKPSNILVEKDGTPRLLDFGIARELQNADEPAEQTRPGLRFLSPDYAAPEWARDGTVGLYTDVYSLGVILYELLAGQLPRMEGDEASPERPPVAGTRMVSLSKAARADLDILCLKAMHRDPRERYQSVEALIRDLDHYLNREPLEARPDSLRYRLGKFVARNRRAVMAASLGLVLLIGLSAFFTWRLAQERNAALAEATRTRRIQRFMLDMFGAGDKEAAPSTDLRVTTLLDRGVRSAAVLDSDPETQGELYENLGRMYRLLGRYPRADELLRTALEKLKRDLGPADPKVIDALMQLGALRGDQAQPEQAEKLVREGLSIASSHYPANDPTVVGAKAALGRVLAQKGLYTQAIAVLEPIVQLPPAGEDGMENLIESLENLAYAHHYLGQNDAAIALFNRALGLNRQVNGKTHPMVADDLANLGTIQATLGKVPEAEHLYREAEAIYNSWYGPDHPQTVQVSTFVAMTLIQEGRLAEADPLLRHVLEVQEQTYGDVHPIVAFTLDTLGKLAVKRNQLDDAERYFSRAAKIDTALFGDENLQTAMIKSHLGDVFLKRAEYGDAERLYRQAVKALTAKPFTGNVSVGVIEVTLGRAIVRQKRYSEAEGYLMSGYEILMKQPSAYPDRLQEAREDLATLYEALHQPEKAEKFRAELAANQPRKKG